MMITNGAKKRLEEVLKVGEFLEVGLKGGGCGGATILLTKVDSKSTDALSIAGTTNVIFADKTSQTYLKEGSLDYNDESFNASFMFKPPLGVESCGCGASIKIG
jgi:iron-sulfur cluster assembly accessory protein